MTDTCYKAPWFHSFPVSNRSPYTGVVNKMVLGLCNDLDVTYSRLGSLTRAHFHTDPPLPHGSFLWWVKYTWACQKGIGGCIFSSVSSEFQAKKKKSSTSRRNIYSQITLLRCYLVITVLGIRDELISGGLAVLKGKWLDTGKPQNSHALLSFLSF